jgi:hypothetical protein
MPALTSVFNHSARRARKKALNLRDLCDLRGAVEKNALSATVTSGKKDAGKTAERRTKN